MGNPAFYYYPDTHGTLEVIDLGALRLSNLIVGQVRTVSDAVSRAGGLYRDSGGMRLMVRISVDRFSDDALVRKLRNMSGHLERGGWVGFTRDTVRAWGGFIDSAATPVVRGATTLSIPSGNAWSAWAAANPPTTADIAIHSAHPESLYEEHTLLNWGLSGAQITLGEGAVYSMEQSPVLVRWLDFFPALKLPAQQVAGLAQAPIVISHRRLNHTLDVTLIEDWETIAASSRSFAGIQPQSSIKSWPVGDVERFGVYTDLSGRID
jgi:hypothetical protein